ncbi:FAFR375Wp [Eremothecium gossypii FDAG1]|nr:FAFR375Wp [Eremothecium gossypii FDAG1]
MSPDPFYQVLQDTQEQVSQLLQARSGSVAPAERQELLAEVDEAVRDLDASVAVLERDAAAPAEVAARRERLAALRHELARARAPSPPPSPPSNALQEQLLREQDSHLDSIHHTMQTLHLQASSMGDELQDQSVLLRDLEGGMDSVAARLARGRRRLQWIYEQNSDRYNDCCIGLLIAALAVLLLLAFAL